MAASYHPPSKHDQELLSTYLDGELSDREREKLEHRLAHDSDLQAALDELSDTVALLRSLPRLKAPRNFTLDPAVHGRPIPWWKRLLTAGNVLQLSGTLGAVASVVVIVLALVTGTGDTTRRDESRADLAGDSVALQPPAEPETAVNVTESRTQIAETAIAYAGEDLIQTTIVAQSTLYAVPPVPDGTPWPAAASEESAPQIELFEGGTASANVIDDSAAAESAFSVPQVAPDADTTVPEMFEAAPAMSPAENTVQALPPGDMEGEMGIGAAGMAVEAPAPPASTATPVSLPADAIGGVEGQATAREHDAQETSTSAQGSAEASLTTTPIAETSPEVNPHESALKRGQDSADADTDQTTSLVLVGAIAFILSIGLIVLGRRKRST